MSLLPNQELEEGLSAAAKSLLHPPSSLDELLTLLDRIEELLSKVTQSPPKSLQTALAPLIKALVSEELMKQSDIDAQVGVAACISEITRITAPEAPYGDEKMKDVFQLIVSSFDNLSNTSSRSHRKRVTILETVAKVRSCVIMLDLELDQMIIEMFQHFLKSIRANHSELIFTSMETIMTLVFEESEYISADLLAPILGALKKNNEEVLPIARKLAEKVIRNGADKIRPCLSKAVNSLNASLDDFNEVVASVCQMNSSSFGHSDENILKDQPRGLSKIEDVDILKTYARNYPVTKDVEEDIKPHDGDPSEDVKEEIKPRDRDPPEDGKEIKSQERDSTLSGSPKSMACNSNYEAGDEETVTDENFLNKAKFNQQSDAKSAFETETESDDMCAEKPAELEAKVEHVPNGDVKPFNSRNNSAESSDLIDDKKQPEQMPCHHEIPSEEIHTSPGESLPIEADNPSNIVKEITVPLSPRKDAGAESVKVASPIERGNLPDENQPKSSGRTKRKENMADEDTASKKASEGANIAGVKKKQRTKKKQLGVKISTDKALNEGVSKNDAGTMSESKARNLDSEKLVDVSSKKGGRVKSKSEKDTSKYSVTEDNEKDREASLVSTEKSAEDDVSQEETPRTGTKRKRTPGSDNNPQISHYGKNLVGSKVKVWWPDDASFYEGVVASYNPVTRKHKVVYDDGDEEKLILRNERWEFVGDDSVLDGDQSAEHPSQDASSNKKKKKGPASAQTSNKREKKDDPPKRKAKGSATKSGSKSKDESKAVPESTENSEDESDKSDHSEESEGESPDRSTKVSGKASVKSRDIGAAKTSGKKKQDAQRSKGKTPQSKGKTPQSKGKTPQSGKTVTPVGKAVKKSSLLKAKTTYPEKSSDTVKGGKSGGSGSRSGKRRRK